MNLSLHGFPGTTSAAATAPAGRHGHGTSAVDIFRALVDGLASGADTAKGVPTDSNSGDPADAGSIHAPKGHAATDDSSVAALNTTATSVQSAVADWTAAPPDEPGAAKKRDAGDGGKKDGKDGASGDKPDGSNPNAVVAMWIVDARPPVTAIASAAGHGTHTGAAAAREDRPAVPGVAWTLSGEAAVADRATNPIDDADGGDRVTLGQNATAPAAAEPAPFKIALDAIAREAAADAAGAAAAAPHAAAASTAAPQPAQDGAQRSSATAPAMPFKTAAAAAHDTTTGAVMPVVAGAHVVSYTSPAFSSLISTASSGASATPAMLPDATAAQIVQTIRIQALGSGGDAHIRLEPTQFGELTVSVRVDQQGQVALRLEADSPAVREWLQSNQGLLRHQLAEQRLTLDRFEVAEPPESNGSSADRRGESREDAEPRHPRRPRQTDADEHFEVVA